MEENTKPLKTPMIPLSERKLERVKVVGNKIVPFSQSDLEELEESKKQPKVNHLESFLSGSRLEPDEDEENTDTEEANVSKKEKKGLPKHNITLFISDKDFKKFTMFAYLTGTSKSAIITDHILKDIEEYEKKNGKIKVK